MLKAKWIATCTFSLALLATNFAFSQLGYGPEAGAEAEVSQPELAQVEIPLVENGNSENSLAKAYFLEGREHFDAGDFNAALEVFRKALFEDPSDPILNHYMGLAAYKLGQYEEALFAFERVLAINPNLSQSRLEKGRTHLALGEKSKARREFERVLEGDVPEEVRSNVELLLAQIGSEPRNFFSGVFLASHSWDSNVTLGTGSLALPFAPSLLSDPTQRSDRVMSSAVVLNHKFAFKKEGLFWKNGIVGFVADNTTVNSNDLGLVAGNTGIEYTHKRHLVDLALLWTYIVLDEHLYQTNPGLSLKYNYVYSPRVTFNAGGSYTRRHHFARNPGTASQFGFVNAWNAGFTFMQSPKGSWNVGFSHKFDKSPRDGQLALAYDRFEFSLKYTRIFSEKFNWNASFVRRKDRYNTRHPVFTDRVRFDYGLIGSFGVTYKYNPTTLFDISSTFTDNNSNINTNTYEVSQLTLSFTKVF